MIPKIIHYTWFGSDPYPAIVKQCIASWQKYLPDYQLVLWDAEKIKEISSEWVDECLSEKKYAFAADYVRLYAVYTYGGIYVDTDFEVYRSFNDLLDARCFIGRESVPYVLLERQVNVFLTSHCFGAEAGHPFIKRCLDYYDGRHFIGCKDKSIPAHLRLDMLMMPYVHSEIAKQYGYDASSKSDRKQELKDGIVVYPSEYFGRINGAVTPQTYGHHHAAGSWREEKWKDTTRYTLWYKISWRLKALRAWYWRKRGYMLLKL